jgi:DNA-binding transcriptional LysR family regulator
VHGVRPADRVLASLREAEVPDLALADELAHGADDVLDRHGLVHAVLVQQIDVVRLQTPERGVDDLAQVLGPAVQPHRLPLLDRKAELGRDHGLIAPSLQGTPEQLLVVERTIDLGRVEHRHAELEGAVDRGDGLGIVASAIGLTHAHAAEPERGHLQRAELACGQQGDLLQHECISFRFASSGAPYAWELERGRRTWRVPVRGGLVVGDSGLRVHLAERGVGLTYAAEPSVADALAAGRLVRVLEPYAAWVPGFFLCYPSRAQRSPALRLFVDTARELATA